MWHELWREVGHFVTTAIAYGFAVVVMVFTLSAFRRLGWRWPLEFVTLFEQLIHTGNTNSDQAVNVEYRDPTGILLDFGSFVTANMRNGRGRSYELREGCFLGCDPGRIRAGSTVVVGIQDGLVKETLKVQLDFEKQLLFVCSRFTRDQLLEQIN